MLHCSDSSMDFQISEEKFDFTEVNEIGSCQFKFYAKADLEKDGFIHPDGSLRFEFFVQKHNYMQRLELANQKIELANQEITHSNWNAHGYT